MPKPPKPCCQNTESPGGTLCGDCPHKPVKPVTDLLDPKDIAARMKERGTFHKDEPWPGWNGGKKIVVPDPPVDDDDSDVVFTPIGPVGQIGIYEEFARDFLGRVCAALGVSKETLAQPFNAGACKYASGGIVSGHWSGRGIPGVSHAGMQISRLPCPRRVPEGTITMIIGGADGGKRVLWYDEQNQPRFDEPPQHVPFVIAPNGEYEIPASAFRSVSSHEIGKEYVSVADWHDHQMRVACGIIEDDEHH